MTIMSQNFIYHQNLFCGDNMQDMTAGNPLKLIIKFSIPLLISNIFQQLYSISDIVIVGRLIGVEALAAVGAATPIFFFLVVVSLGFTNGLTIITAQSFGAKDYERMRRSVATSIILGLGFTLIFDLFIYSFLDVIMNVMNVPEGIYDDCRRFVMVICTGIVVIVAFNALSGFMRALGDSKTPLYFLACTIMINILLNVLYIYYFKMGVAGSALGTVTAMFVSVICCLIYMNKKFPILKPEAKDWKLDKKFINEHLIIAVPMAIHFSILALSMAVVQAICNKFGFLTIAAMTAAMRVEQLATQPMLSIGVAMATYVAQNYGAGMIGRIRRGVFECSLISVTMSIVLAGFVFMFGRQIISVFIEADDVSKETIDEIISLARTYMNISMLFYFALGQIFIFRNACQGMGNSIIALISSTVELFLRCFVALYLAEKFGFVGFCYAGPAAWLGGAAVVALGYVYMIKKASKEMRIKAAKTQNPA